MSSQPREKTVGFVGLGMMGGPMAENILKKGHPLVAYDIDQRKLEHCVGLGAQAGSGPADVARRASRVVSMMVETIGSTTGNSVAFQYSAPRILARDFDGIRMDITYKDVELQTSLAKSLGMPLFMANTALQVYQMGKAMGLG